MAINYIPNLLMKKLGFGWERDSLSGGGDMVYLGTKERLHRLLAFSITADNHIERPLWMRRVFSWQ